MLCNEVWSPKVFHIRFVNALDSFRSCSDSMLNFDDLGVLDLSFDPNSLAELPTAPSTPKSTYPNPATC